MIWVNSPYRKTITDIRDLRKNLEAEKARDLAVFHGDLVTTSESDLRKLRRLGAFPGHERTLL